MTKIAVVKGQDRKENIKKALGLIEEDIGKAIEEKKAKQIFIKINALDTNFPLACTHTEAIEAVLDVLGNKFDEIVIGDNSFAFSKNKGEFYRELRKHPKVKFSDLSEFEHEDIEFKNIGGNKIAKVAYPRDAFIVSLALPKTHDVFVYTGVSKNMFGCVVKGRGFLHVSSLAKRMLRNRDAESNCLKWENLIRVIKQITPDLCILDAYEGMEGEGPLFGSSIKLETAMSSLNGIALDKFASRIYGMENVPYLQVFSNAHTELLKEGFGKIEEISKKFKLHYNNKYQLATGRLSFMPAVDVRFAFSVLKRSYRLRDKIIAKLKRGE